MRPDILKPASSIRTIALILALFIVGADPRAGGLGFDLVEIIFERI